MNIYFRLPKLLSEVFNDNLGGTIKDLDNLALPSKAVTLLKMIKEFLKGRLNKLSNEIANEETESENELYILVDMTSSDGNFKLIPFGYSEKLCQEIQFCVSDEDFANLERLYLQFN